MKITSLQTTTLPKSEILVLSVFSEQKFQQHPWWRELPDDIKQQMLAWQKRRHETFDWLGTKVFHSLHHNIPTVVILGLGAKKQWSVRRDRILARRLIRLAHEHRWENLTIILQRLTAKAARQLTENFVLAEYEFTKYRQAPPHGWPKVRSVTLATKNNNRGVERAIKAGLTVGQAVNACRDLSNTPGGIMTPAMLAAEAKKLLRLPRVRVKVLSPQQIKKLKMGGVLGVAQGSQQPPRFIVIEYAGGAKNKPLVFVGKGVTFDSGGLNVKPGDHMNEMHMDMSGGAAVIAAIRAIAKLKLPVRVIGLVPAVENMPSGSGYRPGDLLRSMSGKTIEVGNTDAEGRVILADGLTYAQKFYQPGLIVDVATLTGAALVALGQQATALFTRDEHLMNAGNKIGELSGDYVWPLPMWDEYESDIKGTFGDVSNTGRSRYAGAINGAMFLYQFAKDQPWIHLDIAPTMTPAEGHWLGKGSAGAAVRWLVTLAEHYRGGKVTV